MKYDAFISYRHIEPDYIVAKKLQSLLERMKVTDPESGQKRNLVIFRDESELPTSDNLGRDIESALENSSFLILICSKEYVKSRWCEREVVYFRSLHKNTNACILPLLIDGEPSEAFPKMLLTEMVQLETASKEVITVEREVEPLAADIRKPSVKEMLHKLSKTEYLRIAAPILHTTFDGLYHRKRRQTMRALLAGMSAAMFLIVAFLVYNMQMLHSVRESRNSLLRAESDRIADLAHDASEEENFLLSLLLNKQALNTLQKTQENGWEDSRAATQIRSNTSVLDRMTSNENYAFTQCLLKENSDIAFDDILFYSERTNIIAVAARGNVVFFDCSTGMEISRFQTDKSAFYRFADEGRVCVCISFPGAVNGYGIVIGYHVLSGEPYFTYEIEIPFDGDYAPDCLIDPETLDSYLFLLENTTPTCVAVFGPDGVKKEVTAYSSSIQAEMEQHFQPDSFGHVDLYFNYLNQNLMPLSESPDKASMEKTLGPLTGQYRCFRHEGCPHPVLTNRHDYDTTGNYYIFKDSSCEEYLMYEDAYFLGASGADVLLAISPEGTSGYRIIRVTFSGNNCADNAAQAAKEQLCTADEKNAFTPDGTKQSILYSDDENGSVVLYTKDSMNLLGFVHHNEETPVFCIPVNSDHFWQYFPRVFQASKDLKHMAIGSEHELKVWSEGDGFVIEKDMQGFVSCAAIRSDGRYAGAAVYTEAEKTTLVILEAPSAKELMRADFDAPIASIEIVGEYILAVTKTYTSSEGPHYYIYHIEKDNTIVPFSSIANPIVGHSGCGIQNSYFPVMLTEDGLFFEYYIYEWWQLAGIYDLHTGEKIFSTVCETALYDPDSRQLVYHKGVVRQTTGASTDISVDYFDAKDRKFIHLRDIRQAGALPVVTDLGQVWTLQDFISGQYCIVHEEGDYTKEAVINLENGKPYFTPYGDYIQMTLKQNHIYWGDQDISAAPFSEILESAERYLTSVNGIRTLSEYERDLYHISTAD